MVLISVQPDKAYGPTDVNVGFDLDHGIFDLWCEAQMDVANRRPLAEEKYMRALAHIDQAMKDDLGRAIDAHARRGYEVDYSKDLQIYRSPMQLDVKSVPGFTETNTPSAAVSDVNALLYKKGKVRMIARVFFKKAPLDLLPRPEIPVNEGRGFLSDERLEEVIPESHRDWNKKA